MASNVTGMTRRSHWRCFLRSTVEEAPSWSGVLFPSMGKWSFRLCRGIKRRLAMWTCCSRHPSWLRALVCAVMTGSFNRTTLQFTAPDWRRTSSRRITSLFFGPSCVFPWYFLVLPLDFFLSHNSQDLLRNVKCLIASNLRQWWRVAHELARTCSTILPRSKTEILFCLCYQEVMTVWLPEGQWHESHIFAQFWTNFWSADEQPVWV